MFFLRTIYRRSVAAQSTPFPTKTSEINKVIISSWYNLQESTSSAWGSCFSTLANDTNPLGFQVHRAVMDWMDGSKLWCSWFSSVEGWCLQSCSSFCCNSFGCFLQKISCSDPSVSYDRRQRILRCLTIWLNQAEVLSALPPFPLNHLYELV